LSLLYTQAVRKQYGGVMAVFDVDFSVEKGSITGLIGPNGAGKTTLFNAITGMDTPTSGKVFYRDENITGMPANRITRLGIARTFQNIRLFKEMTVLDNVMIGRHFKTDLFSLKKRRFLNAMAGLINQKAEEKAISTDALKYLSFFHMEEFSSDLAKNLPYGKQRELEIARALATQPDLLFLDEPAAGMNPSETESLMETIRKIRDSGITVVLIEHDMRLVMNVCDMITVLNYGQKIASGTPEEIKRDELVIEAYLGREE
jgi:branched-chain amino acid transport system ATP-binding protein